MSGRKIAGIEHSALVRFLREFLSGEHVVGALHVREISVCLLLNVASLLEVGLEGLCRGEAWEQRVVGGHDKNITEY